MTDDGFVVPDLIEPISGYRSWTVRVHPSGEPRCARRTGATCGSRAPRTAHAAA